MEEKNNIDRVNDGLMNDLSAEDQKYLEQWSVVHPDHEKFLRLLNSIELSPQVMAKGEAMRSSILSLLNRKIDRSLRRKVWIKVISAAASIAVLLGITGYYSFQQGYNRLNSQQIELSNPLGMKSTVTLPDGSKAILNAGTTLSYPTAFVLPEREVSVQGEVFFEVVHDRNRPFLVKAGDVQVKVLGTKFNVTAYESEPIRSVVLAQGCVQVETTQTPKAILAPNQMFSSVEGKENISQVDVEQMISWVNGLYCFNSADLGIVLKRLSTYYGINVEFDSALSKIKCSGKIDLKDNFETVINGLTFVAPISYAYDGQYKTYRVVKK